MIKIHLLVPHSHRDDIDFRESEDFCIISSAKSAQHGKRFYVIETTEETFTYFSLKYGQDNVWKR